jgi:superfamily I DNA/RNA helicase
MTTDLHCVVVSGQHPDHLGTVTTTSGRSNPNAYRRALLASCLPGPRSICASWETTTIYQWRGSDVSNIVGFRERYPDVASFEITTNRRSRPQIIEIANRFAESIPERLRPAARSVFRPE